MLDSNIRQLSVHKQFRRVMFDSTAHYDSASDGPEVDIIRMINAGKDECPECGLTVPKYAQREHSITFCSKSKLSIGE